MKKRLNTMWLAMTVLALAAFVALPVLAYLDCNTEVTVSGSSGSQCFTVCSLYDDSTGAWTGIIRYRCHLEA